MEEIWKDVKDYEGLYKVSNLGRIKRLDGYIVVNDQYHKRIYKKQIKEKIISQSKDNSGYYLVTLIDTRKANKNKNFKRERVHVIVAKSFLNKEKYHQCVNHKDGDKANNKVENLEWCTCQQNVQHSFKLGLSIVPKGEKNHCAKLTQKDVDYIRTNYKFRDKNFGTVALSKKFKVCPSTISLIIKNKNWKGE